MTLLLLFQGGPLNSIYVGQNVDEVASKLDKTTLEVGQNVVEIASGFGIEYIHIGQNAQEVASGFLIDYIYVGQMVIEVGWIAKGRRFGPALQEM